MSNTIGYTIPACSTGESFSFASSAASDSTGNALGYKIGTMTCPTPRAPEISFLSRYIEATATLCGEVEFVQSTPPRYYKRNDYDAYMDCICYYAGPYEKVTQDLGYRTWSIPDCSPNYSGSFTDFHERTSINWSSLQEQTIVKTATTAIATFDGMTLTDVGGICGAQTDSYVIHGYQSNILSDEDTESAAFSRAIAALSWSAWDDAVYSTSIETRAGSDPTFFMRSVELKTVTETKGSANTSVEIVIQLEDRDYGSTGDWSTAGTQTIVTRTDVDGNLDDLVITLDSTYGKETRIRSSIVQLA